MLKLISPEMMGRLAYNTCPLGSMCQRGQRKGTQSADRPTPQRPGHPAPHLPLGWSCSCTPARMKDLTS